MEAPKIKWLSENGTTISNMRFTSEDGGAVTAGVESKVQKFSITNNYTQGTSTDEAVFDATECYLEVKSTAGTYNVPQIKEQWFKIAADGSAPVFTALGSTSGTEPDSVKFNITAGDTSRPNTISGDANDGNAAGTAAYNICKLQMKVLIPENSLANGGDQTTRLVLHYSYGAN